MSEICIDCGREREKTKVFSFFLLCDCHLLSVQLPLLSVLPTLINHNLYRDMVWIRQKLIRIEYGHLLKSSFYNAAWRQIRFFEQKIETKYRCNWAKASPRPWCQLTHVWDIRRSEVASDDYCQSLFHHRCNSSTFRWATWSVSDTLIFKIASWERQKPPGHTRRAWHAWETN